MASASTIGDRRFQLFDAEHELRDYDAAALSATGSSTAKNIEVRKLRAFKCVLDIAAHSGYSAGSAFWTITVEVSDASGGTYTSVASFVPDGTAKRVEIPLSGEYIAQKDDDADWIRVTATKTSTAGNLTYGAYLCPMM